MGIKTFDFYFKHVKHLSGGDIDKKLEFSLKKGF